MRASFGSYFPGGLFRALGGILICGVLLDRMNSLWNELTISYGSFFPFAILNSRCAVPRRSCAHFVRAGFRRAFAWPFLLSLNICFSVPVFGTGHV